MKSIATLLAFLLVSLPAHAETADCRSLLEGSDQCDDGPIFRRLADGGLEMDDSNLFHLLPDGAVEMRGVGRLPGGTFWIERKDPVSQPDLNDVRR